jgi:isoamylase
MQGKTRMSTKVKIEKISKGEPRPLGVTKFPTGYNFAVHSTKPPTLVIAPKDNPYDLYEIPLDPRVNKTGSIWHILLETSSPFYYGYKVENDLLIDPYARLLDTSYRWGDNEWAKRNERLLAFCTKELPFSWDDDRSPNIDRSELIIYEMHLRGFTKHPSSKVKAPGTFSGLIEKIPYLKELGINAIELLPLLEFDEADCTYTNPETKERLYNYWGYSPLNFFCPMQRYSSSEKPEVGILEFKEAVKALHKAGIEVILDLVFNHTGEGNEKGPKISLKGFSEREYYLLDKEGRHLNFSGCGNTLNCNNPITQDLIIESLSSLVAEFHIDGFRFDLASIFSRGREGKMLAESPLLERITHEPLLKSCKLIAEPWDAAGLHQVGTFFTAAWLGQERWMEWNDDYRNTVRRYLRGDKGYAGRFATKLCGSQDIYGNLGSPANSINFITAHDGFTLADLVSYRYKHNEGNGEEGRDGFGFNDSENWGAEGTSSDKKIIHLRQKIMKNFLLALFCSQGIPMLQMGDEYGHTKWGNNNSWCQDNDINWFSWKDLDENSCFWRFTQGLIRLRKDFPILRQSSFLTPHEVEWHSEKPLTQNWSESSHIVAFTLKNKDEAIYIAFSNSSDAVHITIPAPPRLKKWHRIIYTDAKPPYDFRPLDESPKVTSLNLKLAPHSAILLILHDKN